MYPTYSYTKRVELPGVTVQLVAGHGPTQGDTPMMRRALYCPSTPRVLLENLTVSRGKVKKSVGRAGVEQHLIATCEARGEDALHALRDQARALAPSLGLERELAILDGLIGAVPGTRKTEMSTPAGKAMVAHIPYDAHRLALFEKLAAALRSVPLRQPAAGPRSEQSRLHFTFLDASVPAGTARALLAMFLVSEVHPFLDAMQWIHQWTAAFDYESLDKVIADMQLCNAFEKSRVQHQLLFPQNA
ncbi:hypothetical protein [Hydrogenophaga sp.]|uniref:hypothetical protein n=1 Tax=Hydrogenophaga sp. TaxID=1904254 RepID=UPI00271AF0D8|nr:hypothetical protein [Hydrogenophaga sp.]MDO9603172.1 hypothetical protein [Hydrogenophaga sp.]